MRPVEAVLDKLEGVRPNGDGHVARCPCLDHGKGRGDRNPSLSNKEGDDGRVLLKCFAGCGNERIVDALGLQMRDLFDRRDDKGEGRAYTSSETGSTDQPCTLESYAALKRLPVSFLKDLGLKEYHRLGEKAVSMPYLDASGENELLVRSRVSLSGKRDSRLTEWVRLRTRRGLSVVEYRNERHQGWFWIDAAVVEDYGEKLGPYGLLMYMGLARHADNSTRASHPGIKRLAKKMGISYDSANRGLKALQSAGLMEKRVRHRDDGSQTSNEYVLLPVVANSEEGSLTATGEVAGSNGGGRSQRGHELDSVELDSSELNRGDLNIIGEATNELFKLNGVIAKFPKDHDHIARYIADLSVEFPNVPVLPTCKSIVAWNLDNPKKTKNLLSHTRGWFERESQKIERNGGVREETPMEASARRRAETKRYLEERRRLEAGGDSE